MARKRGKAPSKRAYARLTRAECNFFLPAIAGPPFRGCPSAPRGEGFSDSPAHVRVSPVSVRMKMEI